MISVILFLFPQFLFAAAKRERCDSFYFNLRRSDISTQITNFFHGYYEYKGNQGKGFSFPYYKHQKRQAFIYKYKEKWLVSNSVGRTSSWLSAEYTPTCPTEVNKWSYLDSKQPSGWAATDEILYRPTFCETWFYNLNDVPVVDKMKEQYHGQYILSTSYVNGEAYYSHLENEAYVYKNQRKWMISNKPGSKSGWFVTNQVGDCPSASTEWDYAKNGWKVTSAVKYQPTKWSIFGEWYPCSASCGLSSRTQSRNCINGVPGQIGCEGHELHVEECSNDKCMFTVIFVHAYMSVGILKGVTVPFYPLFSNTDYALFRFFHKFLVFLLYSY